MASGPWATDLPSNEICLRGLKAMIRTRAFDRQMSLAFKKGQVTFYITSEGEEAISCAHAFALSQGDMVFPAYRQQGFLIARDPSLIHI